MIHYVRKLFYQIFYTVYIISRCLTMDKLNHKAVTSLNEVSDSELDIILGGSRWWQGVVPTVSHECRMNSFQHVFTCC